MLHRPHRFAKIFLAVTLAVRAFGAESIVPQPVVDPQIAGFHFPEREAVLTGWITATTRGLPSEDFAAAKIQTHGWGLWAAITAETEQVYEGQTLRVFETWRTPEEL